MTEKKTQTGSSVADNLRAIKAEIAAAGEKWQQTMANTELVAVSKRQDVEKIRAALEAGQRIFGENRVQEAMNKWPELKVQYPDIVLHLIGPLQTNKVKEAVALFDVIEVVDRPKLARALAAEMAKQERSLPCYIQVNTGEEPQKSGIRPDEADQFITYCRKDLNLDIVGLMCIPPAGHQPAPHFALLKKIADRNDLEFLSMGMSGDYLTAVQFGATSVRIGTAIFGEREDA